MASLIVAGILLAIAVPSLSRFPNGQLYPFDIDSLLTCHEDNPLAGTPGQEPFIPEQIVRLPFSGQVVRQPPHPDDIWLPPPPPFRIPPGIPDTDRLIAFLGNDYDPLLTARSIPAREAPRGCEISPTTDGSGGNFRVHISVDQDPTPILNENRAFDVDVRNLRSSDPSTAGRRGQEDPDTGLDRPNPDDFTSQNIMDTENVLLNLINSRDVLCPFWTGLCPLNTTWAELPDGYFPKFYAQGTCSNKNCSWPRGKHCEEDFQYTAYVTVLRWDCCFDRQLGQIQWACGWRKVGVPLLCDCMCACSEVFTALSENPTLGPTPPPPN